MIDWLNEGKQNDEKAEWLKWRSKGIGSSDIPVIMGVSPWKTPFQLWLEKTKIKPSNFTGNWATERGNRLEPLVRMWYNIEYNADMTPTNAEYANNKLFRASADGVDTELVRLIEIKCPNIKDHKLALAGEIPEKYIPQCQWLMMVFDIPCLHYVSYSDSTEITEVQNYAVVEVEADRSYQQEMQKKAAEFWSCVEKRESPSSTEEYIDSTEMETALAEYNVVKTEIELLKEKLDSITENIKSMVRTEKAVSKNSTMGWVTRKGNVDYKAIPELGKIDLEKYRKPSTKFFQIRAK